MGLAGIQDGNFYGVSHHFINNDGYAIGLRYWIPAKSVRE
jgi:hypothetical protein